MFSGLVARSCVELSRLKAKGNFREKVADLFSKLPNLVKLPKLLLLINKDVSYSKGKTQMWTKTLYHNMLLPFITH